MSCLITSTSWNRVNVHTSILPEPLTPIQPLHFSFLPFFPPSFILFYSLSRLFYYSCTLLNFPLPLSLLPRLLSLLAPCHLALIILTLLSISLFHVLTSLLPSSRWMLSLSLLHHFSLPPPLLSYPSPICSPSP